MTKSSVKIALSDSFDLHSFLPRDVPGVLDEYLRVALEKGYREVRVIHGKGKFVRRAEVIRFLTSHPSVESVSVAPAERGGVGATVVRLRARPVSSG